MATAGVIAFFAPMFLFALGRIAKALENLADIHSERTLYESRIDD